MPIDRDTVIRLARTTAFVSADKRGRTDIEFDDHGLVRFANLIAEHEREECNRHSLTTIADALQYVLDQQERQEGGPLPDDAMSSRVWPETPTRGVLKGWIAQLRRFGLPGLHERESAARERRRAADQREAEESIARARANAGY